ncbi:hypothetical protein SUDANB6_05036 [Streptomyces sp. enrichment culture]
MAGGEDLPAGDRTGDPAALPLRAADRGEAADAGRLVAPQEREVVRNRSLAVVRIGMADPAGPHGDEYFPGPGAGNDDRPRFDERSTDDSGYGTNLMRHVQAPPVLRNALWVAR